MPESFSLLCSLSPSRTLELLNESADKSIADTNESESHMRNAIELRRAKRYRLSAPALFMWAPPDGEAHSGQGAIRDINTYGVYVHTDAVPPVGARIQMQIVLPKLTDSGPGMHLQGEGVVLRCEDGDANKRGFAASAQFYPEATEAVFSHLNASLQAN